MSKILMFYIVSQNGLHTIKELIILTLISKTRSRVPGVNSWGSPLETTTVVGEPFPTTP